MEITTTENKEIQLDAVFKSITLKTADGEEMKICMRDTGFEFKYEGKWYSAKDGQVMPFKKSVRGNYLVDQTPQCDVDMVNSKIDVTEPCKHHWIFKGRIHATNERYCLICSHRQAM